MDFYLLLIIPHIAALVALFAIAWNTLDGHGVDPDDEFGNGGDGGSQLPPDPGAAPPGGGLPLPGGLPPRRRLKVGEALADLHPEPQRRQHDRPAPVPATPPEPSTR